MAVNRDNVLAIIEQANVVADVSKLRDDVRLADQGIDSLEVFNVLLRLEEKYGIEIPDADVDHLGTIMEIVDYLNKRLS